MKSHRIQRYRKLQLTITTDSVGGEQKAIFGKDVFFPDNEFGKNMAVEPDT